jgi:hypothetical protein
MNDQTPIDERIRAALHAAVDDVREQDLRPAHPPRGSATRSHRTIRWAAPLLAAAAVVGVVVTTVALSSTPQAQHGVPPAHSRLRALKTPSEPAPSASGSALKSAEAEQSKAAAAAESAVSSHASIAARMKAELTQIALLDSEALWPFASYQEAQRWQTVDGPAGHAPWHLDARQTALMFVSGYLHFNDITRVTSAKVGRDAAGIGVGYALPNGQLHTAAVVQVVRYSPTGGDDSAPWEVVGATSSGLSLDTPAVRDLITSPVTVKGRITGVDESIAVTLRTLGGGLAAATPVPAGGDRTPWSVSVTFGFHGVVTIVASTGGHLTAHERFVVTGVSAS